MSREAMKLALEVLENDAMQRTYAGGVRITNAAIALRAALAEPEQPVAWMYDFLNPDNREEVIRNWVTQNPDDIEREKGFHVRPLYTAPTPRKPLSEQELDAMRQADGGALNFVTLRAFRVIARAIERAHGIGEQHE